MSKKADLPCEVVEFLKDFSAKAKGMAEIRQIRLYGSYADNRWTKDSDVDIAVFIEDNHSHRIKDVYKSLHLLCCDYSLDVQIQVFLESELEKPMGIIEEVVFHGIDVAALI